MKVKFELSPFRCISNRTLPFFPLFNPTIIIPRTKISFLRFWRHFIYVKSYFSCWFRKLCKLEDFFALHLFQRFSKICANSLFIKKIANKLPFHEVLFEIDRCMNTFYTHYKSSNPYYEISRPVSFEEPRFFPLFIEKIVILTAFSTKF